MTDAEIICLFFLGDRQRNSLIFNEFRSLFPQGNAERFNNMIGNFANSESCSIIELKILLQELIGDGKNIRNT